MNSTKIQASSQETSWQRREFLTTLLTIGASSLVGVPAAAKIAAPQLTVQDVIDLILKEIPGAPFKETVDTIKAGDSGQQVTGIVTTMFATEEVIKKAAGLGANFIIAHEPTYYNHLDETSWLENDDVFQSKIELLKKYNMTVWRCHDYLHAHRPDGVLMGVLTALGWEKYYDAEKPRILRLPETSLGELTAHLKKALKIERVRVIGEAAQHCSKIALMPGAAGGTRQIETIRSEKPDVLICGEVHEWETAEYVRDARYKGSKTALIVLGHAVSEEAGLEWLVRWLKPKLSGITITHIPSKNPFSFA